MSYAVTSAATAALGVSGLSLQRITFVVEGKPLSIDTRFLLPVDYFFNMLSSGMKENQTGQMKIEAFSFESFKIFLSYLEEGEIPTRISDSDLVELYSIAHQYLHTVLLNKVRGELIKKINVNSKRNLRRSVSL